MCKPKVEGGLGFEKISLRKYALLEKLLWRFLRESSVLWHQIILSIYNMVISLSLEGYCTQGSKYRLSPVQLNQVVFALVFSTLSLMPDTILITDSPQNGLNSVNLVEIPS